MRRSFTSRTIPLLAFLSIAISGQALAGAGRFVLLGGGFSFSGQSSSRSGSIQGVGDYLLGYEYDVVNQVSVGIGYSLLSSGLGSGDTAYGPEISARYYPLTRTQGAEWTSPSGSIRFQELYRPYVGAAFGQRQFQSISSGYAGFGAVAGVERALEQSALSLRLELRYFLLFGPSNATATELGGMIGASMGL